VGWSMLNFVYGFTGTECKLCHRWFLSVQECAKAQAQAQAQAQNKNNPDLFNQALFYDFDEKQCP